MKKLLITILLGVAMATRATNVNYTVTNDLTSTVAVFYWTNTVSTNYTFMLSNNIAPGADYIYSLATNGPAGLGIQGINGTASILVPWAQIKGTNTFVSQLFNTALSIGAPASETVPQLQTVLKSYYITGAVPTEDNYWEFIDTMYWYANYCATNANWAAQSAAAVQAGPHVWALYEGAYNPATSTVTNGLDENISNIVVQNGFEGVPSQIQFTFSNSLPDTYYVVAVDPTTTTNGGFNSAGKTTNSVTLYFTSTAYHNGFIPYNFFIER
jgi:hypothetical protein